jgi:tRNA-2-methylthio-N6-dimethylallyladenosine synthase
MSCQIDENVKEERNRDLLELINRSNRRILERLVGTRVEVLCEGPSKTNRERLMGRTSTNKIVVFPPSTKQQSIRQTVEFTGQLVDVQIERANGFSLYGTPLIE